MPYGHTTLNDRATQLLTKYKSGALVTQLGAQSFESFSFRSRKGRGRNNLFIKSAINVKLEFYQNFSVRTNLLSILCRISVSTSSNSFHFIKSTLCKNIALSERQIFELLEEIMFLRYLSNTFVYDGSPSQQNMFCISLGSLRGKTTCF